MQRSVRYQRLILTCALVSSALSGCTRTNMRYNLRRVDSTAILFPPYSSRAHHNSNEYAAALTNARQNAQGCWQAAKSFHENVGVVTG
jgi:hypothetical protein